MMMTKGVVLGNYLFAIGIKVDLVKNNVNLRISTPNMQKEVHKFLGKVGYNRIFIQICAKISFPLFSLLIKYKDFVWTKKCNKTFESLKDV